MVASLLTLLASAPRVEILHHYLQNRLEADIAAAMPLFIVEDQTLCALAVSALAIVGCGGIAGAMEYFSLNWARPPPTFSDEKNAIADALGDRRFIRAHTWKLARTSATPKGMARPSRSVMIKRRNEL